MCGIAGIFEKQGSKQIPQYLHQMMDKLAHRGPDDEGYVLLSPYPELAIVPLTGKHTNPQTKKELQGGSILEADSNIWIGGIGHRRLSIFDTSAAGHQPMLRENYAIVFNGAIYNYRELRADLEKEGYKFKSNSDTEVLLTGYMHWQERVLPKLDGMFSFSIIDLANNKLFAARDRLGVKPFYYLDDPQWFAFASEQKALYGLPICNQRISKSAVFEYLVQGKNDGQTTGIVKSVLELMPGSCLEYYFDTSTTKVSVWYALDSNQKSESYKEGSYKRYRDKVSQLLTTSVALHLRSDVPLGACLSGGIDSSALVGIASELLQKSNPSFTGLPVFTASFPGNSFDETLLAQQTAQNLGATWYGVTPTEDELTSDLIDFVQTHDVPLQTLSSYAQYRVMQKASQEGIKITLDGQGADELFAGYALHYQSFFLELLEAGNYSSAFVQYLQSNNNFANRSQTSKTLIKVLQSRFLTRHTLENNYKKRYPELEFLRNSFWDTQKRRLKDELRGVQPGLNAQLTADLQGSTMRTHLRIADRNSMRFGIESRVPFADSKDLIAYVQNIPSVYKIKNGENKNLLRSAVRKWVSPEVLKKRDKTGFEGPNKQWLEHISPILREAILTPGMEDFMHIHSIHQNWDNLLKSALATDPHRLFRFAALGLWLKHVYQGNG